MRTNRYVALLVLGSSLVTPAMACICAGITGFLEQLPKADLVLEGEVIRAPHPNEANSLWPITELKVNKIIKGEIGNSPDRDSVILTDPKICSAPISSSELTPGKTYLLALYAQPKKLVANRLAQEATALGQTYQMAPCSESALLKVGDEVFSFERSKASGYVPQPKPYGSYADLLQYISTKTTGQPPTTKSP